MKNIIKWCICLIIFTVSCKDKPEPKPLGNPDDLIGKWASTDSILFQRSGDYVYIKDTLTFSKDITNHLGTFPYFMAITGYDSAASCARPDAFAAGASRAP